MTKQQITLVQHSWCKIESLAQQAGEKFYVKLFNSEPLLRHLFKTDLRQQACKLTAMLNYLIKNLDNKNTLQPELEKLGRRHNGYGAQPEHYYIVAECLLTTISDGMKNEWTPELKDAWVALLQWLTDTMQNA
jgi:nitric oxide dioxygenase